jgi:hypothetical protein
MMARACSSVRPCPEVPDDAAERVLPEHAQLAKMEAVVMSLDWMLMFIPMLIRVK